MLRCCVSSQRASVPSNSGPPPVLQWFGDLVTPAWWEDVWLKEGFAHFFEYVGTDFLFPKWNMVSEHSADGGVGGELLRGLSLERLFPTLVVT